MDLRPYQHECLNRVFAEWEKARSTLAVLPTGCGKTIVFAAVLARWLQENAGRALVVAHREELIYQAVDKIGRVTGQQPAVEMADLRADDADGWSDRARIVVTTVQTQNAGPSCPHCLCPTCAPGKSLFPGTGDLFPGDRKDCPQCGGAGRLLVCAHCVEGRRARMLRFNPEEFGVLIVDECHHAPAASYRRLLRYYQHAKILGVTATPDRHDEEALGQVFASVAYHYELPDAIRDGYLVPILQQVVRVEEVDFSGVRTTAGELNQGDVERALLPALDVDRDKPADELTPAEREALEREERILHGYINPTFRLAGDRPTLIFTASVAHAERVAEIIDRHRPGMAVALHGETPGDERRRVLDRFRRGEFQWLVNCSLFLEGFDEPRIACVAVYKPTKSRALYAQIVGRGTRCLPGVIDTPWRETDPDDRREAIALSAKADCLVLDFVGNSGRHRLVSATDLLGGNFSEEVVELAIASSAAKSATGSPVNPQDELAAAQAQLDEERRKRRAVVARTVHYSTQKINPFDVLDVTAGREPGWHKGRKPTERQKEFLASKGVAVEDVSFWEASELIEGLIDRSKQGMCTYKQAKVLARFGYDVRVSFERAREIIDALAANGWQRPTDAVEV